MFLWKQHYFENSQRAVLQYVSGDSLPLVCSFDHFKTRANKALTSCRIQNFVWCTVEEITFCLDISLRKTLFLVWLYQEWGRTNLETHYSSYFVNVMTEIASTNGLLKTQKLKQKMTIKYSENTFIQLDLS